MTKKTTEGKDKAVQPRTAGGAEPIRRAPSKPVEEPPKAAVPAPAKKTPVPRKGASLSDKLGGGPAVWWAKTAQFFREVKVELKKVTWPSRKEALASTSVVVALVLLASIFLGLVDMGLSRLIRSVIG